MTIGSIAGARWSRPCARIGIKDERVLGALAEVPRHLFVPEAYRSQAYAVDVSINIGDGQTISQAGWSPDDRGGASGPRTGFWRSAPVPATRQQCWRALRGSSSPSSGCRRLARGRRRPLDDLGYREHQRQGHGRHAGVAGSRALRRHHGHRRRAGSSRAAARAADRRRTSRRPRRAARSAGAQGRRETARSVSWPASSKRLASYR